MLLLLSRFSRVRLCATPETAAHQAPPSLGFSRQDTGVSCHFLQCMKVKSESEVAQSCPTLRDTMDWSLPSSSVRGIFQARVLEWGAITSIYKRTIKPLENDIGCTTISHMNLSAPIQRRDQRLHSLLRNIAASGKKGNSPWAQRLWAREHQASWVEPSALPAACSHSAQPFMARAAALWLIIMVAGVDLSFQGPVTVDTI